MARKIALTLFSVSRRFPSLYSPKVVISANGREVSIPVNTYIQRDSGWKRDVLAAMVSEGSGIIDIGANMGQTLVDWKLCGVSGQYVGFEPNHRAFELATEIIEANGYDDCLIVPCGLSDRNAIVKLFLHKGKPSDSCASIIDDLRPGLEFDTKAIPVFQLDDISDDLPLDSISFVKIDVEGAELPVLLGMRKFIEQQKPIILCEVLFADANASYEIYNSKIDDLESLVNSMNYTKYQILKSRSTITLKAVNSIPRAVWTKENSDMCDYIFAPGPLHNQLLETRGETC
jgi:FkbM family methyltransferase